MVQSVVPQSQHGLSQLLGRRRAEAVLERPHALGVKYAHPVTVAQDMVQIWPEAGHGTQLPIDEGGPSLLATHP